MWGVEFGVLGLGSGVWGLESGVWSLGSGVWGLGSRLWCLWSMVSGLELMGLMSRARQERRQRRDPLLPLLSQLLPPPRCNHLISHKVYPMSVCRSQLPHQSVNSPFTIANMKNKLTEFGRGLGFDNRADSGATHSCHSSRNSSFRQAQCPASSVPSRRRALSGQSSGTPLSWRDR